MSTIARRRMRELLDTEQCVTCASVFDPLSSRMADDIGFQVGILGGSVTSLMALGVPDITLLTLSELASQARRVCSASDLPVIVDGDNGYGNALNVMRAIQDLEHAGAALVTLEDTVLPRPYKEPALCLSTLEEATGKLKAAVRARKDPGLSIFARTHALDSQSLDELLTRVHAYSATGIDGICIFGLSEKETLALIAQATELPIMLISYGDLDLGTPEELARQNVRIRLSGHHAYEAAVKATYQSLLALHQGTERAAGGQSAAQIIKSYSQQRHYAALSAAYIHPANGH